VAWHLLNGTQGAGGTGVEAIEVTITEVEAIEVTITEVEAIMVTTTGAE